MESHKINPKLAILMNTLYTKILFQVTEYQKELLEDKSMYLKALSDADSNGKVDSLYGLVVERIIKSHADFFSIGR